MFLALRCIRRPLLTLVISSLLGLSPALATAADSVVSDSGAEPLTKPAHAKPSWAGFGVRLGQTRYRLDGGSLRGYIDDQGRKRGSDLAGQIAARHLHDLEESAFTLSPSVHLGGSGYFFKAELPVSFATSFTSVGLGVYPLNYGVHVPGLGLFPYASLGVSAHAARGKGEQDGRWTGGFAQARGALGIKWRAARKTSLSLEAGLAKAAGLLSAPPSAGSSLGGLEDVRPTMDARGGFGQAFDVSLGIERL